MSVPTVINLNDTTPVAPSGDTNAKWQADSNNPRNVSAYFPNWGSVNAQSGTSYTLAASDRGKLVTLTNSSAVALTNAGGLPNSFLCGIENLGTGTVTFTPASGTINGQATLALAQYGGALLFFDGTNWEAITGTGGGGGASGGVLVKTASYSAVAGDSGKLVVFNSGSAVTYTLLATPSSSTWAVFVANLGAGLLTVNPNGANLDGASASLVLAQLQGLYLATDGTNYYTERGLQRLTLGFCINAGFLGNDVGPLLVAPRAGALSKCVLVVNDSDPILSLSFRIKQNGTDIFSTNPSAAAGTASGTVSTFSLANPTQSVAAGDLFQIDILGGSSLWQFTAQLEA